MFRFLILLLAIVATSFAAVPTAANSGRYTPTCTPVVVPEYSTLPPFLASIVPSSATWIRVGNNLMVGGDVKITSNVGWSAAYFTISLPGVTASSCSGTAVYDANIGSTSFVTQSTGVTAAISARSGSALFYATGFPAQASTFHYTFTCAV